LKNIIVLKNCKFRPYKPIEIDGEHAGAHVERYMMSRSCFEEEITLKFPYLEVWLNEITTIYPGIKAQQTIGSCWSIMRTCRINM